MEFPIQPVIWGVPFNLHLIFELLAYSGGFRYYLYTRKNKPPFLTLNQQLRLFLGCIAGALFGSRFVGVLEQPHLLAHLNGYADWYFFILGNKTIVGGIWGGLIGIEVAKKFLGITSSTGDRMTEPILLGMFVGRIGCFLQGLEDGTTGIATSLPWGIDFGDGIFRHPIVLYEMLLLLFIWICVRWLQKYTLPDGALFKVFLFSYMLFRFGIEFIKPYQPIGFGLSIIHYICLLTIAFSLFFSSKFWKGQET